MSGAPFEFTRAVRFDEVDAAGFVYFANVAGLAHEALERFLEATSEGGYARWIRGDDGPRIGLPCVHLSCDFRAALRFGDTIVVRLGVRAMGVTSVRFAVTVTRGDRTTGVGGAGDVVSATVEYIVACAELDGPTKQPLPPTLRGLFERLLEA